MLRNYTQATERLDEQDVIDLLAKTPQGEEIMPTFIDRYIEQGVQKGLQQGMQQGMQKGLLNGKAKILMRQMQRKFGTLSAQHQKRIRQADETTLLSWSERLLFATSIDEVLR